MDVAERCRRAAERNKYMDVPDSFGTPELLDARDEIIYLRALLAEAEQRASHWACKYESATNPTKDE